MKKYLVIFIILFIYPEINAQTVKKENKQDWKVRLSKEVRESGDPFYQRGDTLYLLFDRTDTLQFRYDTDIQWLLRPFTEEEKKVLKNGDNSVLLAVRKRFAPKNKKRLTLSSQDLEGKILTTRKELMDFYEREFPRRLARFRETNDSIDLIAPDSWDLRVYFKRIYMIIPLENEKFLMYEVFW
ncbi:MULTISPECIES: hypothetical protein [Gabonibacter]|uniref:hypothetical protein n=1 Tax=Gabonibacter TaxID=1911312 RepID=UPI00073E572B|nr:MULTISPECIES: hypothetical protein [Gabonibacter]MCR9011398.1 hypothetical protein [Gabonibacter chumensis]